MFMSDQPTKHNTTFVPWIDRIARIGANKDVKVRPPPPPPPPPPPRPLRIRLWLSRAPLSLQNLNYKPSRPAPIITVTKLQTGAQAKQASVLSFGGGASQMTWDSFVDWLGQYTVLEFGN